MQGSIFTAWQPSALRSQVASSVFEARTACAREFIAEALTVTPYVVVVTDETSHKILEGSGAHLLYMEQRDMGLTRRAALLKSIDLIRDQPEGVVMWSEPEKVGVPKYFPNFISQLHAASSDVLIPQRKSLSSYPTWQQPWEETGNKMCGQVLGSEFDYFFGPRVMSLTAAQIFLGYPGTQVVPDTWDALYSPLVDCVRRGLKFTNMEIDFEYPPLQRATEQFDLGMLRRRVYILDVIVTQMVARLQFLHEHES